MIQSSKKRFLLLIVNFLIFGGIYWGLGNTTLTIGVTYVYYALCLILSVLYVFVAGGLKSPPLPEEKKQEKKKQKQKIYHPVKQREKYRSFRKTQGEKVEKKTSQRELGPNILGIPEEKRSTICYYLMLFVLPFYAIFLLDWFYLKFFV